MDPEWGNIVEIHRIYRSVSSPAIMPVDWQPVGSANRHILGQTVIVSAAHAVAFSTKLNETIQDVITFQGETALFECKLVGYPDPLSTWYKDGAILTNDYRTITTANGPWRRLQINRVQISDQGIYVLKCRLNNVYISSLARLFVAPRHINAGVFYYNWDSRELGVLKHLRNVDVISGGHIILEAHFKHASEDYFWFKNNNVIFPDDNTIILNDRYTATLSILNAQTTDTGVYFVVSKAKMGYVASHADVRVREHGEMIKELPEILEMLPDEVEPFPGQEMRLNVKVAMDRHTILRWQKDGNEIDHRTCIPVDYGSNYIGLQMASPASYMTGTVAVVLNNERSNTQANSCTKLTVSLYPLKAPPVVNVIRPLESAVAVTGSKVSFDCSFDLEDPIYFYVVWYVGHYKVERTNSMFNVLWGNGQYVLYIKKLLPDMEGEVICELRRAWPGNKSAMVNRTSSYLAIVPLGIIQEERKRLPTLLVSKICYELYSDVNNIRIGENETPLGCVPLNPATHAPEPIEFLTKIVYSRLDDEGLYYLHAWRGNTRVTDRLVVYDKDQMEAGNSPKITVFEWSDSLPADSAWYLIELGQPNGTFIEAGVTSRPRFEVENPPFERLMMFRISAVRPLSHVFDSAVYIVPPTESALRPLKPHEPQPMDAFEEKYQKTDDLVGLGSFGSVQLVLNNHDGLSYAAKHIKMRIMRREESILREFYTMAKLSHHNLIELIDFYMSKFMYIFVMDYCWGGELFDRIVEEEHIKEIDMVGYIRQLCEGLRYIHDKKIVHLDVKPENIVCPHPNSGRVKLIDFGLAREVTQEPARALYGTRDYVAPEVLDFEPISTACDMWSLGVVVYVCLSGVMPFTGETWAERCANITRVNYNYNDSAFDEISEVAKDFVNLLLIKQPRKRLTAAGTLAHPWISDGPPLGSASAQMKKARANLKSYLAEYRTKWQRAGNVLRAAHRLRNRGRHDVTAPAPSTSADELIPPKT